MALNALFALAFYFREPVAAVFYVGLPTQDLRIREIFRNIKYNKNLN
jgi:hypothetical protein